jgi:hypothetical protein
MKKFKTKQDLMKSLPLNMNIAEVGVFKGDFSKFIFEFLRPNNLYLIDIFEGNMGSGDQGGNNMQFVNLEQELKSLQNFFKNNKNVFFLKGLSHSQIGKIPDNHLDMIYIDASHEYEDVKKDLQLSFPKVKINGYICGHDYEINRFPGVVNAVNEFCEENNLKINCITEDGLPTFLIQKYE